MRIDIVMSRIYDSNGKVRKSYEFEKVICGCDGTISVVNVKEVLKLAN